MSSNVVAIHTAHNTDLNDGTAAVTPISGGAKTAKLVSADKAFGRTGNIFTPDAFTDIVIEDGWNERDYTREDVRAKIDEYKESIKEVGILRPLIGYRRRTDGKLVVTDGHLRLFAVHENAAEAQAAGREDYLRRVPFMIKDGNDADHIFVMITANSGLSHTPMEEARQLRRLEALGCTQKEIVAKSGWKASKLASLRELLTMPRKVQDMIENDQVSQAMVKDLMAKHDDKTVVALLEEKLAAKTEAVTAEIQAKEVKDAEKATRKAKPAADDAEAPVVHPGVAVNTAKPKVKLTRTDVSEAPRVNVKLAQQRANFAEARIVEEDGRKYMMVDLEEWNSLRRALGIV
jgi:ParB-like chromosome segregation protein Spo0J